MPAQNKEYKEYLEHKIEKMRIKQNIKLRAFVINYIAVLIVWLLFMYTPLLGFAAAMMRMTLEQANMYMMVIIGFWKILAAVLFLVPAIAIWWERCALRKYLY